MTASDADVIVVGAGLAGLVASAELADAGRRVLVVEQEGEQSLGGQAWWVEGMNALAASDAPRVDPAALEQEVLARDRANPFGKDLQLVALRGARHYVGDRLIRTAPPHRFLDHAHGPLIAVRLHVLTRKTLGGRETDLGARALDGTFLGGCLSAGRAAGRATSADVA